jgi:hypothetical protein
VFGYPNGVGLPTKEDILILIWIGIMVVVFVVISFWALIGLVDYFISWFFACNHPLKERG